MSRGAEGEEDEEAALADRLTRLSASERRWRVGGIKKRGKGRVRREEGGFEEVTGVSRSDSESSEEAEEEME